ncbi:MAG: M48 family metallopeptidase [Pseudomonadota bacterium]|nr:M48 family metallopeptidase [Pseudomonadota bacterium]
MKGRGGLLVAASLALALATAGCGHPGPDAPTPPLSDSPAARLEGLTQLDVRVANVAWRLALANADLCPVNHPRAGWTLQSANQYGAELRPLAIRRYGLEGDLPGVLAAPPDSPAARAGLAPGDLILAVDGRTLAPGAAGAESYDGLEANLAVLDAALSRGPARLSVRRDGVVREVRLDPVLACANPAEVRVGGGSAAISRTGRILVPADMATLAETDDQLAFLIAHELAHAVLEHSPPPAQPGVRGAANARLTLRRGRTGGAEADADRLGLYLLARAGFDARLATEFLVRFAEQQSLPDSPQISLVSGSLYRSPNGRRRALQPVIEDIAARAAAGRDLIP